MKVIFLGTLLLFAAPLVAADARLTIDTHLLVEVRSIESFPAYVKETLGWQKTGIEGIADKFGKFNATNAVDSRLPMRRFITGGACSTSALLAYEQGGRSHSFHAIAFSVGPQGWVEAGEWILPGPPHSLRAILEFVDSKDYPGPSKLFRIWQPSRREGPMRKINISDEEVREIQAITATVSPDSIVNISGVVTGCPCEDGPACTDQVWIVAYRPNQSRGLQLSRVSDHWTFGPVQQWWLDWDSLHASRGRLSWKELKSAESELQDRFPQCSNSSTNGETAPLK